jgi:hypothetical protein
MRPPLAHMCPPLAVPVSTTGGTLMAPYPPLAVPVSKSTTGSTCVQIHDWQYLCPNPRLAVPVSKSTTGSTCVQIHHWQYQCPNPPLAVAVSTTAFYLCLLISLGQGVNLLRQSSTPRVRPLIVRLLPTPTKKFTGNRVTRGKKRQKMITYRYQRCGAMKFWYGSGSGSADPCL